MELSEMGERGERGIQCGESADESQRFYGGNVGEEGEGGAALGRIELKGAEVAGEEGASAARDPPRGDESGERDEEKERSSTEQGRRKRNNREANREEGKGEKEGKRTAGSYSLAIDK